jgi:hypothetical protein
MADDNEKPLEGGTALSTAKLRLEQVQQQLVPTPTESSPATPSRATPNTGRRRRKSASKPKDPRDKLPPDYSDILGQISTLKKIAATPDPNNRGYLRQKQAGKLWVRERVERLLDEGTFREVGSVSGTVRWRKVAEAREEPTDCM